MLMGLRTIATSSMWPLPTPCWALHRGQRRDAHLKGLDACRAYYSLASTHFRHPDASWPQPLSGTCFQAAPNFQADQASKETRGTPAIVATINAAAITALLSAIVASYD